MDKDALIGLRFEMSGGVGRMAGVVLGKAGELYLVQRDGVEHSELLELSDLRTARFFGASRSSAPVPGQSTTRLASPAAAAPVSSGGRLSDKIRRSATSDDTRIE